MIDYANAPHNMVLESIVDVLSNKIQNTDRAFFRAIGAYFMSQVASIMRAKIVDKNGNDIPVNNFTVALAPSGFGKGYSVTICEQEIFANFRKRFLEETFTLLSDQNLWRLAIERAAVTGTTETEEKAALDKEFNSAGALMLSFDSATPAAVKQLRHKMILANSAALSLQIDEIGSNLLGSIDVLTMFLELYDQGLIKNKLVKNSAENVRSSEIAGKTPTNMLLFGTPTKLLNGATTEDEFASMLAIGYARRCLFSWGIAQEGEESRTAEEVYAARTDTSNAQTIAKWAQHFAILADPSKVNWEMTVPDNVGIELVRYQMACKKKAKALPEHDETRKAELEHRHSKAIKLAGAFAFVEESAVIEMDHLAAAVKLVEESGEAFERLMNREKSYMKLARYISASGDTEFTHADLHEALPFYKSSPGARNELMTMAIAWGYKQHIIIRKTFLDGIEFYSGETLKETNLDELMLSYSTHFANDYVYARVPFTDLEQLAVAKGYHWANHAFVNEHRSEEDAIPGFNLVVLDIDNGVSLKHAHDLMSEYTFMTYTTKRHTDAENRFRLILPMNYELKLNADDYREFMQAVYAWLPFEVDTSTIDRSRKWTSFSKAQVHRNEGKLIDALTFIPKTAKNEQYQGQMRELQSLDNLERWFAQRMVNGNRNNQMIKFALALVDSGMSYSEVERKVLEFNARLADGLSVDELRMTVLRTVAQRMAKSA
jgi:hypothetical protein